MPRPRPRRTGRNLIAFFGSEGLYCYDLDGRLRWKKDLGALDQGAFDVPDYQWGSASSPILWNGKVLLQVDLHKDSFLAAFDARTGRELWRTPRDVKPAWSSPTVVVGPARTEIVTTRTKVVLLGTGTPVPDPDPPDLPLLSWLTIAPILSISGQVLCGVLRRPSSAVKLRQ